MLLIKVRFWKVMYVIIFRLISKWKEIEYIIINDWGEMEWEKSVYVKF